MTNFILENFDGIKKLNCSLAITGVGRSGTTILGKLVHSLKNIEYFFEPPMFVPIMSSSSGLYQKLLLTFYFNDDLLISALAGRSINTNPNDDSSIFGVKAREEIDYRLSKSFSRKELDTIADQYKVAFKIPSAVNYLLSYKRHFPGSTLVYMHRDPVEVISSILEKEWFRDRDAVESPLAECKVVEGRTVPYWVPDDFSIDYYSLSEIDRAAYYYLINIRAASTSSQFHWVDYEVLLASPNQVVSDIADLLNTEPTAMTSKIISSIKKRDKKRDLSILGKISSEFKEIFDYVS